MKPVPYHLDAVLGVSVIVYLTWIKRVEWRSRQNAQVLPAKVLKVFPHRHCTSYFVEYAWEGGARIAEYRGAPLRRAHEPGDAIEILIDPALAPDIPLPVGHHNAPNAGVGSGTCSLAGTPLVTRLDLLYFAGAAVLIVRSFWG